MKRKLLLIISFLILSNCSILSQATTVCDSHDWSEWLSVYEPSYSSEGCEFRFCYNCDESEERDLPKLSATKTQKPVKKAVDNFFSAAKKYNTPKIKKCFVNPSKLKLFESKKYMAKFFKEKNKDLEYEITSIKVKGKSATVKVDCSYSDSSNAFYNSFGDVVKYMSKNPKASSTQIDKYQYKRVIKWRRSMSDESDFKTLTIKLKKVGKTWKISSYTKAMDNVIHRNYQKAYNEYF